VTKCERDIVMSSDNGGDSQRPNETGSSPQIAQSEDEDHVKQFIASLAPAQQACVQALEKLHSDSETLKVRYRKEQRSLDRKYEELVSPMFRRRASIISGEAESSRPGEGIPEFWLRCMKQNAAMRENITARDEHVLKYLIDVRSVTLPEEEGIGFRLEFVFKPNDFFTNDVLCKTYYMLDSDFHDVDRAQGTVIDWKENRNLTVKTIRKRQRKKNSNETRIVVKTEPCESFFNFFSPPVIPQPGEGAPVDSDEIEQRRDELESDLDLGLGFFEDLVPYAIKWFTGEDADSSDDDDSVNESDDESESGGGEDDNEMKDADYDVTKDESGVFDVESFMHSLPEPQKQRVQELLTLDTEAQSLFYAQRRELRALDRKYEQLNSPIFAERARIVSGESPPVLGGTAGEGIPGFWLEVMKNCRTVGEYVTERDEPALQNLVDVIATTLPEVQEDSSTAAAAEEKKEPKTWCYQLEFIFRPNEFFSNSSLVKKYWLVDSDTIEVLRSEGSTIQWKEGKCLTMRVVRQKRRNRGGRGLRTVMRQERCDSFFHFFAPPNPPPEGSDGDDDGSARELYEEELEIDGEVCYNIYCALLHVL
jgi:nucleosome assembly protein 1-like 1